MLKENLIKITYTLVRNNKLVPLEKIILEFLVKIPREKRGELNGAGVILSVRFK